MTPGSRARWIGYALAAALTGAAMLAVREPGNDDTVLPVVRVPARVALTTAKTGPNGGTTAGPNSADGAAPVLAQPTPRVATAPLADPFAVIADGAPPDATNNATTAKPAAPDPVAPPPAAPPLPFVYLGSWKEQGKTHLYLQRAQQLYKVSGPGALDADYAVQAIDGQRVTLKYLPLGTLQDLRRDAPPATNQAAAAADPNTDGEPQAGN